MYPSKSSPLNMNFPGAKNSYNWTIYLIKGGKIEHIRKKVTRLKLTEKNNIFKEYFGIYQINCFL